MKILALLLTGFLPFVVSAATDCTQNRTDCRYYMDKAGALVDRKNDKKIIDIDPNDSFSDVSIFKYGDQYVLLKENFSIDRALVAVPLEEKNGKLGYSAIFNFSIDLIASTDRSTPVWNAQRMHTKNALPDSMIWNNVGPTSQQHMSKPLLIVVTNEWPHTSVFIKNDKKESASSKCFAPFDSDSDHFPIADVACRSVSPPIPSGLYDLSGIMGRRIFISMHLEKKSNTLVGWYKYHSGNGGRIRLEGYISDSGQFKINEYGSTSDQITGRFTGEIRDGAFVGNWQSSDGKKKFVTIFYQQGFS